MLIPEWNPETTSDGTTRAASSRRIKSASHGIVFTQLDHLKDPYRVRSQTRYPVDLLHFQTDPNSL